MPYFLTTPIYYVNAEPHLGHAYTTIAADVLARHMRQRGEEVFFLTGTDEHGEPIAQAAEAQGMTPQELVDQNAPKFQALVELLGASNDFFVRTSDPEHKKAVQEVLQRVHDAGHVYAGHYEGYYCPRCADFKSDAELIDGNKCPIHLIELEREVEDNWFFRLSAFQEPLERWYAEHSEWVLPDFRYNEALSFIKQGLQDVSLSRRRISWGVEVPWEPSQVFYVWFDALLNYYTALTYAPGASVEKFWPPNVQLLAKDILKIHAVIWPALLMAADLPLPTQLYIHGYLLMDEHKMSKSLGNVIDPVQIIERFGPDPLRFYLMREVSFGQDGNVSAEGFENRYTTELANEYGNLASRTLAMVERYRDGQTTKPSELPLAESFAGLNEAVCGRLDRVDVTGALDEIWQRIRALNAFVTAQEPWKLAKDSTKDSQLDAVLYALVEGLRVVSLLLLPWMPVSAEKVLNALGEPHRGLAEFGDWPGGTVSKINPLFPRIED
ncbi:MAG: methionyl-tRNA synthetase [Thermoleophilaceae bacterium]|nr:methionyl-tRNA synthetase [Thermoleophilaceae bacterium]